MKKKINPLFPPSRDNNIFEAFKPLYVLLTIFGLLPYSFTFNDMNSQFIIMPRSLCRNFVCALFNLSLILISWLCHVHYINSYTESTSIKDAVLTEMNYKLELLALASFCFVSYIMIYLDRERNVKILNRITKVKLRMLALTGEDSCEKIRKHVYVRVLVPLLSILLIHMAINSTRNDSLTKIILVMFSFILPQTIQFALIAYLHTILLFVKYILRDMSVILLNMNKGIRMNNCHFFEAKSFLFYFRNIKMSYVEVFEVIKDVNTAFGVPVLITIIGCFHAIVSEAHIIYHGVIVERMLHFHWILNSSMWILWQLIKIQVLSQCGETLKFETKNMVQSLYNIPTEKMDERVLLEIQHFSRQICFQRIELNVCSYFVLDSTLMYNIVAAMTTYFIIFVQFDKK